VYSVLNSHKKIFLREKEFVYTLHYDWHRWT